LDRRSFVKLAGLASGSLALASCNVKSPSTKVIAPLVIATWANRVAVQAAWDILANGGSVVDAVEAGARIPEADSNDRSVGFGGHPDKRGVMSLDASIMDGKGNCGAVAAVEGIKHPISLARVVMEKTPHVLMVGDGAQALAREHGFEVEDILSTESKNDYLKWLETQGDYSPFEHPTDNHDTIGILAINSNLLIAGACSSSGMAYKLPGRVGDAPVIGAGLFVDDEVGAATATGNGEEMIRIAGSHLIVELMRMGMSPQKACEEAVARVIRKHGDAAKDILVCFLAINRRGEVGAWSTRDGFEYTLISSEHSLEVHKVGNAFQ
jgi:N4-(beta-N-acetylglucosaminyl)-L-asparaginase